MSGLKSKVIPNARWEIKSGILYKHKTSGNYEVFPGYAPKEYKRLLKSDYEMIKKDHEFIENFDPVMYCNDTTGEMWAFDTKLPTGGWLENIKQKWAKDGTMVFRACILY